MHSCNYFSDENILNEQMHAIQRNYCSLVGRELTVASRKEYNEIRLSPAPKKREYQRKESFWGIKISNAIIFLIIFSSNAQELVEKKIQVKFNGSNTGKDERQKKNPSPQKSQGKKKKKIKKKSILSRHCHRKDCSSSL